MRQLLGGGGRRRGGGVAGRADGRLRDAFSEGRWLVLGLLGLQRAVVRAGGETLYAESWRGRARGGQRLRENLVTRMWLWRSRRPPLLALGCARTGRAGGTTCMRERVLPSGLSRPGDAVPRVAGRDRGWDSAPLFFFRLAAFVFVVLLERVGGYWWLRRGRAGSGAPPFERGERACVGGCGLPSGGRGRSLLLLGF